MPEPNPILELAKRRGFFWPAFEIYGGGAGFYEYGPYGTLLKLRIESLIRDFYVIHEDCLLFEAPALTPMQPWVASGHATNFVDVQTECTKCGESFRADHWVEEKTGKLPGDLSPDGLDAAIRAAKIKCPRCSNPLSKPSAFNMMFQTSIGPGKNKLPATLRPETAQTTYMAFRRLSEIARRQLPFGVLQLGKSFRNEISPRKAIIRLRELTQMEVQFFVDPARKSTHPKFSSVRSRSVPVLTKDNQTKPKPMSIGDLVAKKHASEFIAYYLARSLELSEHMGIDGTKLRLRQHRDDERSFYSADTWDVEYVSDHFGVIELCGIADRTDYDLGRHQETAKVDLALDVNGKKILPHVIEAAYGIDRPLYCVLESCYQKDSDRAVLKLPPAMAPIQVAVFPLVKKDGLPETAQQIHETLKQAGFYAVYDEGFIGKVYYRQDEIGTLAAVTVDYDTKTGQTVTLRDRNTQQQIRLPITDLVPAIRKLLAGASISTLGKPVK